MDLTLVADSEVYEYYSNYKQNHPGDSGIDVIFPYSFILLPGETQIIDLGIRAITNTSFNLVPRSSISKTPFRQPNSPAVIDREYRGRLKAAISCQPLSLLRTILLTIFIFITLKAYYDQAAIRFIIYTILLGYYVYRSHVYVIHKGTKLFQIVSPDLKEINLTRVINTDDVDLNEIINTQRGEGGFGSTGH